MTSINPSISSPTVSTENRLNSINSEIKTLNQFIRSEGQTLTHTEKTAIQEKVNNLTNKINSLTEEANKLLSSDDKKNKDAGETLFHQIIPLKLSLAKLDTKPAPKLEISKADTQPNITADGPPEAKSTPVKRDSVRVAKDIEQTATPILNQQAERTKDQKEAQRARLAQAGNAREGIQKQPKQEEPTKVKQTAAETPQTSAPRLTRNDKNIGTQEVAKGREEIKNDMDRQALDNVEREINTILADRTPNAEKKDRLNALLSNLNDVEQSPNKEISDKAKELKLNINKEIASLTINTSASQASASQVKSTVSKTQTASATPNISSQNPKPVKTASEQLEHLRNVFNEKIRTNIKNLKEQKTKLSEELKGSKGSRKKEIEKELTVIEKKISDLNETINRTKPEERRLIVQKMKELPKVSANIELPSVSLNPQALKVIQEIANSERDYNTHLKLGRSQILKLSSQIDEKVKSGVKLTKEEEEIKETIEEKLSHLDKAIESSDKNLKILFGTTDSNGQATPGVLIPIRTKADDGSEIIEYKLNPNQFLLLFEGNNLEHWMSSHMYAIDIMNLGIDIDKRTNMQQKLVINEALAEGGLGGGQGMLAITSKANQRPGKFPLFLRDLMKQIPEDESFFVQLKQANSNMEMFMTEFNKAL